MDKVAKHMMICNQMNSIYKSKNQDYGDSFAKTFDEYGPVMCAIRLEDKLQRFKRLIKADAQVKDESIEDTLKDMANYAIIALIEMDRKKHENMKHSIP